MKNYKHIFSVTQGPERPKTTIPNALRKFFVMTLIYVPRTYTRPFETMFPYVAH